MPGPAVEAYIYLYERAFDKGEHSFVRNLESIADEDWDAVVPGQPFGRSIGYIAWHTVAGKHLYWDHAFGEKKLNGAITGEGVKNPRRLLPDVLAYGRLWQEKWLASISQLDDEALAAPTTAHWGAVLSMRRVIAAVIEHDLYHAGEINHLRAVLQGTDKAPWD